MTKILIVASVASMVDQFLMPYIKDYSQRGWKIVVATNFDNPGTITNERSQELVNNLKKLGVTAEQIDFVRSPLSKENLNAYKQLFTVMNSEQFDIIHSHSPIGGLLTRLVAKNNKKQKLAKVIYTAHGFHFHETAPKLNWLVYYPVEKYMARYTDALITMNEQDYQLAKTKFKTRQANGVYKVNGVGIDLSEYTVSNEIDYEFKASLDIPKDNFVITIIGELNQNKNQIQMIQAIEQLNDPKMTLLLVGSGDNYELFKEQYKHSINIKILGYRTDIKALLNITDVVASMSYREGLPKNVMEAMAAEKPVIATNIRGNQDLVVDGETGYLVPTDNVEATISAIKKLKNEGNNFGKNVEKQIEKYRIEEVLKRIETIYFKCNI